MHFCAIFRIACAWVALGLGMSALWPQQWCYFWLGIQVVSVRFFTTNLLIFSLFETMQISHFIYLIKLLFTWFSIHWSFLFKLIITMMVTRRWFAIIPSALIGWYATVSLRCLSCLSVYLLTYSASILSRPIRCSWLIFDVPWLSLRVRKSWLLSVNNWLYKPRFWCKVCSLLLGCHCF